MKLSEIKGERVLEVIADIVEPVSRIAQDDAVREMFARRKVPKGKTAKEYFGERVRKGLPALLKGHAEDIVEVLAVVNGVPKDEYERDLTFQRLFADVMDIMTDEELLGFLASSPTEKGSAASGDASVSTGDRSE